MTNGQKLGLCGIVGLLVMGSLLWRPIMFFGIPAGVIGALAGFAMYRVYREDDTDHGNRRRLIGAAIGGVAAMVLAVSVGGNVLADGGFFAPARPATVSDSASHTTATYASGPTVPSAAGARAGIEKATEWCRGMYEAYDPDGSGFRECMKRRVPASEYGVVARDVSLSRDARRAEAMAKSVRYC